MKQGQCLFGFALGKSFEDDNLVDTQAETELQEAKRVEEKGELY